MRTFGVLGLSLLLGAQGAWAQRPQTRAGFWFGFGVGGGAASFRCDGCRFSDEVKGAGLTLHLRMGGTINPKLLIGGELNGWGKDDSGLESLAGSLSGAAYFFPAPARGLFFKAGVGYTVYSASGGDDEFTSAGFGGILGAGYDVRIRRNVSLTPVVNITYGRGGDLELNGGPYYTGFRQSVVELALGLTFH